MTAKINPRRSCLLTILAMLAVAAGTAAVLALFQWRNLPTWYRNLQAMAAVPEYASGLNTPASVLDYLKVETDSSAMAAYTAGTTDADAVLLNADERRPLGATINLLLLAVYAEQVEQGLIDPQEQLPISEWERFYLPDFDDGAHRAALFDLLIAGDFAGFAQDPDELVTVEQIVQAMVQHEDLAAADWLLERLGPQAVANFINDAGLEQQDLPLPFSGMYLSWHSHQQPQQRDEHILELAELSRAEYATEVARLTAAYQDPAWRAAELRWRGNGVAKAVPYYALAFEQLAPRGSAAEYARILDGVARGEFRSPQVSAIMREYLDWPMQTDLNQQTFEVFGTISSALPGLQTAASFYVPLEGDYAGRPRIVVLFLNQLSLPAYVSFSESLVQPAFMREYALDAEFAAGVARELGN
jgi:hypothetical protein